jgi:hypothetical protein
MERYIDDDIKYDYSSGEGEEDRSSFIFCVYLVLAIALIITMCNANLWIRYG